MILDIRFKDTGPVQYQGVKSTSVYLLPATAGKNAIGPELILYFYEITPSIYLPLDNIESIVITND